MSEIVRAAFVPGWGAWPRCRVPAVALFAGGIVAPFAVAVYAVASGRGWVALGLDTTFLGWVMTAGILAIAARLGALGECWIAAGRPRPSWRRDRWALVVVIAVLTPLAVGVVQVGRARASIAPTFEGGARPLFDAAAAPIDTRPAAADIVAPTGGTVTSATVPPAAAEVVVPRIDPVPERIAPAASTTTTTTTLPPKPARPRSGVDPAAIADVSTILLIGGDSGPGRQGMRTDTMMLFSIHRPSGRAALVSVPRNLERMLFPPGSALESRYPYGFTDMANAVYPIVSSRRSLRDAYQRDGVRPGVVALAHGLGYSLDVTIDDYVLLDMQGFLELVDALGGVTVNVPKAVPMPGNVPGAPAGYPDVIGPGVIHMDGSTALGYVRSRVGDTDYHRARRQRDVLAALAVQVSLVDVVGSYTDITSTLGGTLRTSLTSDELADLLAVIGGETAIVESVGLVPPLVNVRNPDWQQLARIVGDVRVALATGVPSGW